MRPVIILTTTSKRSDADRLAVLLVTQKLAACVNIIPNLESHYRWKGKICREKEFLLIIKTSLKKTAQLQEVILKNHPYETPEFLILPVRGGSKKYLQWMRDSLK